MSGIAAIVRFDGGAVEPGRIEAMTAAMAYRGVDGIAHWRSGGVALGHLMLHTTAESLEEVQPLANEDESLVLVMDGWLSNWQELRTGLLARGAKLRSRSDAELVLRAYEVWGEDCPKHIDGEFAFLIWDARAGEAYLTHDHIGLKSLHYHWDGRRLVVGSDIVGVLAGPDVPAEPNRGKIAEIIGHDVIARDQTVWQGVMRAMPARWFRFGRNGVRSGQYWQPPIGARSERRSDAEYFEEYRALFADCVRRSSRSHLPLACDVSGGLDSSAVFAMAHHLRRDGKLPAPAVKGYTYFFEDAPGSDIDEIEYARAVARHTGEEVREIDPFRPDAAWFVQRGFEDRNIAGYPNGAMSIAIGEALVQDGCRVILNGEGGDEWLAGKRFYFAEQLAARDWPALAASFREDRAELGLRATAWNLLRHGLAPNLPRWLLDARLRLRDMLGPDEFASASWLAPDMLELLNQRRAARDRKQFTSIRNPAHRSMFMVMTDPFAILVWDQFSRQSARIGYEIRTPLYARKFIEFAFATPERLRLRGNISKYIHRAALAGLLPEAVLNRKTKAEFSLAFNRHLLAADGFPAGAGHGNGSGYLDRKRVGTLKDSYDGDYAQGRVMWALWSIFEIESLFGSKN